MLVSVVLCTRNPRPDTFARVIAAIARQTLPATDWELVLVDNGSKPPVTVPTTPGLPPVRTVVEDTVGLTPARIRGILEATGELIVFVDDDNLLDRDYLANAVGIAREFPRIGAFGGRLSPEFEGIEPLWLRPFRAHIALTDFTRDEWANVAGDGAILPCGAGLCIRRPYATAYASAVLRDPRRLTLDRADTGLTSCGDTDMVLSCADAGAGTGRFTALHLTHVIPVSRLDFKYRKQLAADIGRSFGRLRAMRGESSRGRRAIALAKTVLAFLGIKHRGRARSLDLAYHFGYWRGLTCSVGSLPRWRAQDWS